MSAAASRNPLSLGQECRCDLDRGGIVGSFGHSCIHPTAQARPILRDLRSTSSLLRTVRAEELRNVQEASAFTVHDLPPVRRHREFAQAERETEGRHDPGSPALPESCLTFFAPFWQACGSTVISGYSELTP